MEAMRAMRINIFIAAQLKASATSLSDVKIGMYLFLVFRDRQACFQLMMKCSMSFAVFAGGAREYWRVFEACHDDASSVCNVSRMRCKCS
jgi:hypothetical protein